MAEKETWEDQFIKGFNEGYIISKEAPEIAETLSKASGDSSRLQGFKEGRKQFALEQSKDHYPSWLKEGNNRREHRTKGKDIERE